MFLKLFILGEKFSEIFLKIPMWGSYIARTNFILVGKNSEIFKKIYVLGQNILSYRTKIFIL